MGSIEMPLIDPFAPTVLRHPDVPHVAAHVIPFGLNVTRLLFQDPSNEKQHDLIVGPETEGDHWSKGRTFLGPIIGRYANRLPAGQHAITPNDKRTIDIPEFSAPGVSLHGGPIVYEAINEVEEGAPLVAQKGPLDQLVWTRLCGSTQSRFFGAESPSRPSGSSAIFAVCSQGVEEGEKGYPGTVRIEVRLSIEPGQGSTVDVDVGRSAGALRVHYRARLEEGESCTATPLNLTHHWGFNLSASDDEGRAQDKGQIDDHTLRMFTPATLYTPQLDEQNVPTGALDACTAGGKHDWLHAGENGFGQRLMRKDGLPQCYDHYYGWGKDALAEQQQQQQQYGQAPPTRVLLHAPATKLSLAFSTNQSGVQVYAATGQPDAPAEADKAGGAKKRVHAASDEDAKLGNALRSYVALEFAHPHATFLHKAYQDLAQDTTILHKGQQYDSWVQVEVFKA